MTQATTIEQLSTLFERDLPTTADATYIEALRNRWKEPATRTGFFLLAGLVKVSKLPQKYVIHPLEYWHVERISLHELSRFAIPLEAREKLNRAYAAGIPVKWLLWAEQQITPPQIEYRQQIIYVVNHSRLKHGSLVRL